MRKRKHEREQKRQRGQYMTPRVLVNDIVQRIPVEECNRILEPSCGDGAFLTRMRDKIREEKSNRSGAVEMIGIEIDNALASLCRDRLAGTPHLNTNNVSVDVYESDFFRAYLTGKLGDCGSTARSLSPGTFDLIVGNPPFGGTFDHSIEDVLDSRLGRRLGKKIKKETYAFFIVACIDLLRPGGRLTFVCSKTLLTIPTMAGLRHFLASSGEVEVVDVVQFSRETSYPMIVLDFVKSGRPGRVSRNGASVDRRAIEATPNLSWGVTSELAPLFDGPLMGDHFVASSGMTTGRNAYFVRPVDESGCLVEPYRFEFYDAPITVGYEARRARLGRLSAQRRASLVAAEARGDKERRVAVRRRRNPLTVKLPDPRYVPYNKANGHLVFSEPTHYIFWEDEGDAVLTYKRTGNWYLRGVGGEPFFRREGLTWQLVASRLIARYLPPGYILDSGAPCAFPRSSRGDGKEILFALGWLLSDLANRVLKTVINHTMNIQSKDVERMPYPWWVTESSREEVIRGVERMIGAAQLGRQWTWEDEEIRYNSMLFDWKGDVKIGKDLGRRGNKGDHGMVDGLFGKGRPSG